LGTFLEQLAATRWYEWLGMVAGITGVWLSIKEKIAAWAFFITCYSCYVYISYRSGLHAFMGMNIMFIGISIYGWTKWSRQDDGVASSVTRTLRAHLWIVLTCIALGTVGIGYLLASTGAANQPYLDAFATCCGFSAQWMLGRKQIETWLFWIISNSVYAGIFISAGLWPSVLLFAVFILLAIKGWREWQVQVNGRTPTIQL
jgi:nicotinamide mononucleotide transporter